MSVQRAAEHKAVGERSNNLLALRAILTFTTSADLRHYIRFLDKPKERGKVASVHTPNLVPAVSLGELDKLTKLGSSAKLGLYAVLLARDLFRVGDDVCKLVEHLEAVEVNRELLFEVVSVIKL